MYSICDIPLDNEAMGWSIQSDSEFMPELQMESTELRTPGIDGYKKISRSPRIAPTLPLVIRTPKENLNTLMALFAQDDAYISLVDTPTRRAFFELYSMKPKGLTPFDETVEVSIALGIPGVYWRDRDMTYGVSQPIANPVEYFNVFPDISGKINDAQIFVGGAFGHVEVRDSGGSFVRTTKIWAHPGYGMLYIAETRRAFMATVADPWIPLGDVSDGIATSGGSRFQIEPYLIADDPDDRTGRIKVTTDNQSGVTFRVAARGAYLVE